MDVSSRGGCAESSGSGLLGMNVIYMGGFKNSQSTAESAHLVIWENHPALQSITNSTIKSPDLLLYEDCDMKKWRIGLENAQVQNFVRNLFETPPNLMTPRTFAHSVVQSLYKTNVNITLRGERWMMNHNTNAVLENTKGSALGPILVEVCYCGCDPSSQPVVLIGKGIVFNSGCFCLKTYEEMKHMQGDLAGVCDFQRFCKIGTTLNFIGLTTLGENIPEGKAGKSMDIVKSSSGNSILEDLRDFRGSLMIADAYCFILQS